MSEDAPRLRSQEHEIEIDAPVEAAWKAISAAEELTRWYVEDARVEEGEGGTRWIDWGGGQAVETIQEIWEPGARVRLVPSQPGDPAAGGALTEDWTVETRGGRTVVRLVFSGLPEGGHWDAMYEGTELGWEMFLVALRHYLERHPGKPRTTEYRYAMIPESREQIWNRLIGSDVLAAKGDLSGVSAGDRYAVTAANGEVMEGTVLIHRPQRTLTCSIDSHDDALFMSTLHAVPGGIYANAIVAGFGLDDAAAQAFHARWGPLLDAFCRPAPAAPSG